MNNKQVSLMSLLFEGKEHDRLETLLKEYAVKKGFNAEVNFKNGMNPDVLLQDGKRNLFLGDAKDANNEGPSNTSTANRILGYIKTFAECVSTKEISGGYIAIATNDKDAASEWKNWLNAACEDSGLSNPNFMVEQLSINTFIVLW